MSISSFNKGMDDGHFGNLPDEGKMLNDRDYFEGYCMAEDIEAQREYEETMKKIQEEDYYQSLKEDEEVYYERLRREGKE